MSTTAKALIIIGVCLFIIVSAAIGFGVYWWTHNAKDIVKATESSMKEGQDAGKKTDNQGCVDEAISRYKNKPGFTNAVSTGLFLQSCLRESKPTQGFCDDVPSAFDFTESAKWQAEKCKAAGLSDPYCRQIFAQVQQYCQQRRLAPNK